MATRNEQTSRLLSAARTGPALAAVVASNAPLNAYNIAHALHCAQALAPAERDGLGAFARALGPLLELVCAGAGRLGAKHVSKAFWALSKLGRLADVAELRACEPARVALCARLEALATELDAQALTNCLYALALSEAAPAQALLLALIAAVRAHAARFGPKDVSTFLRSRARVLALLAPALRRTAADGGDTSEAQAELLALVLAPDAAGKVRAMSAADVSDCAWLLGRLAPAAFGGGGGGDAAAAWRAPLRAAAGALATRAGALTAGERADWQCLGHLSFFAREAARCGGLGAETARALEAGLAPACAPALDGARQAVADATALLLARAPELLRAARLAPAAEVLVFEDGRACAALSKAPHGLRCRHWRRFSHRGRPGRAWAPAPRSSRGGAPAARASARYAACALRMPALAASLVLALHGAAARLAPAAPLWVYGALDEGVEAHGLRALRGVVGACADGELRPLFANVRVVASAAGCVLLSATRAAGSAARARCADWRERGTISFPAARAAAGAGAMTVPWSTLPGLFAAGELDMMTAFLLQALPTPPRAARVLDFGCGSGSLGGALRARCASVACTLLDADALALAVARRNVRGGGVALACSDGFRGIPTESRGAFDWIVSNPPVHARNGIAQDFGVLRALVRAAPRFLRASGGCLFLVSQEYVPCGLLLAAHGGYARVDATYSADGRFVVWCARTGAADADAEAGAHEVPGGRKRRAGELPSRLPSDYSEEDDRDPSRSRFKTD